MDNKKIEELIKLCLPVAQFLKDNFHPYVTVVINENVKVEETVSCSNIEQLNS